ncbi:MAG: hypothetical protein ABR915_15445, partial [Thermoguttaceae bacterium]
FRDLGAGENRQIRSTKLQTNPKSQIQNPKSNTLPWQADDGKVSQEPLSVPNRPYYIELALVLSRAWSCHGSRFLRG